jgi:Cu(I)/Ag(I) efflux system membrane protein CusA/SilA
MVTAPLLSMLVVPAAWYLLQRRRLARLTSAFHAEPAAAPLRPREEGA